MNKFQIVWVVFLEMRQLIEQSTVHNCTAVFQIHWMMKTTAEEIDPKRNAFIVKKNWIVWIVKIKRTVSKSWLLLATPVLLANCAVELFWWLLLFLRWLYELYTLVDVPNKWSFPISRSKMMVSPRIWYDVCRGLVGQLFAALIVPVGDGNGLLLSCSGIDIFNGAYITFEFSTVLLVLAGISNNGWST